MFPSVIHKNFPYDELLICNLFFICWVPCEFLRWDISYKRMFIIILIIFIYITVIIISIIICLSPSVFPCSLMFFCYTLFFSRNWFGRYIFIIFLVPSFHLPGDWGVCVCKYIRKGPNVLKKIQPVYVSVYDGQDLRPILLPMKFLDIHLIYKKYFGIIPSVKWRLY